MNRPTVALVTAIAARDLDPDLEPLAAGLEGRGVRPVIASWDDVAVDWSAFAVAVLRSTWDYHERFVAFDRWLDHADLQTTVWNPPSLVRWSLDKRYIADLAAAGVPTVPTQFLPPGAEPPLASAEILARAELASTEIVVKPTVSAGSRDTGRFEAADPAAQALVAHIWASGRTAMIQPYLHEIDNAGEHALVYLDGSFSHAFRKGPILKPGAGLVADLFAEEHITPAEATPAQRMAADTAVEAVERLAGERPLYARVDLLPSAEGPRLLELELAEPSLYHHTGPGSAERFAHAIVTRLG